MKTWQRTICCFALLGASAAAWAQSEPVNDRVDGVNAIAPVSGQATVQPSTGAVPSGNVIPAIPGNTVGVGNVNAPVNPMLPDVLVRVNNAALRPRAPATQPLLPDPVPATPEARPAAETAELPAAKGVAWTEASRAAFAQASEAFRRGDSRAAVTTLEPLIRHDEAPLPVRQLYIAALVGSNRVVLARYETLQAARDYPKEFLTDRTMLPLCQSCREFPIYLSEVRAVSRNATSRELVTLAALFEVWAGHPADARRLLGGLNVSPPEPWWTALIQSLPEDPPAK